VTGCYDQLIAPDVMPAYFINFDVDPATIDVNIHPQKHEIKFENEFPIRQILVAAVKQALGKINAAGAIDFDGDQMLDIPVFLPDPQAAMPGIDLDTNYNPFDESIDTSLDRRIERRSAATPIQSMSKVNSGARTSVPQDWDKLYESFTTRRDAPTPEAPEDTAPMVITSAMSTPAKAPTPSELPLESTEQMANLSINNKYIVVPARDGMLVIDRRRAHIRVLYNRFMAQLSKSQLSSQKLIFPETITLSPSRSAILSSITSVVAQLGYDVSFLGDNTWAINSVPVLPGHANPSETLSAMVADIEETGEIPEEGVLGPAALSLARSAAIAPGQQLTSEEIESLMAELFTASEPAHTPDGLKTFVRITYADLGKLFT
jgi:DNA mismatch repair protein MutL